MSKYVLIMLKYLENDRKLEEKGMLLYINLLN